MPREGFQEIANIEDRLSSWELRVACLITEIPRGRLINYECLAALARDRPNRRPPSRAVANLRRKLYVLLGHQTQVPLHRVASKGALNSERDSIETTDENRNRRAEEGTPKDRSAWACRCRRG